MTLHLHFLLTGGRLVVQTNRNKWQAKNIQYQQNTAKECYGHRGASAANSTAVCLFKARKGRPPGRGWFFFLCASIRVQVPKLLRVRNHGVISFGGFWRRWCALPLFSHVRTKVRRWRGVRTCAFIYYYNSDITVRMPNLLLPGKKIPSSSSVLLLVRTYVQGASALLVLEDKN